MFPTTCYSFAIPGSVLLDMVSAAFTKSVEERDTIIPWDAWGSSIAAWLPYDTNHRWSLTTHGQRFVYLPSEDERFIRVRDYNPYKVKKMLAKTELPANVTIVREEAEYAPGRFEVEVHSRVPYVEYVMKSKPSYDGVMIDEERIIGMRVCKLQCYRFSLINFSFLLAE